MALANRKNNRRIFQKTGNGSLKMEDDKITKISQSFASNVHINAPETPDAAQAMIYAIQGIEEDVEELHRHISSDDLAVNITGNAATATALTAGNKTLDGNFTIETNHTLTTNRLTAPSDTDLQINTDKDMYFRIDTDGDTANKFHWEHYQAGAQSYTSLATFDENAELTIISTQDDKPKITINQQSNTVTAAAPQLEFYRQGVSTDNKELGDIVWSGLHQYGSKQTYAQIVGKLEESSVPSQGGQILLQVASNDGEMVTGLKIEDGNAEDEIDITIGSGTNSLTNVAGNLKTVGSIELGHASDTTIARSAAGEVTIEGKKIVTENHVKHVLNCGWNGNATVLQWLPFGYGGTGEAYYYSSNSGYLEMGGFVAPCDGHVDFVVIRAEEAAGYSTVGIHIAKPNTEVPATTGTYAFTSPTVSMINDDTGYKFTNFTNSGGVSNSFSAGDVIMFSFDPQNASGDSVATAVLNLDWTNTL